MDEQVAPTLATGYEGGGAILLIDDNAVQAATRQMILRRAGHFVIAVLNPLRALEQFQSHEFPVDVRLVITDHLMPGMTGSEFVGELRKSHPNLPVLVISGLEEAEAEFDQNDLPASIGLRLPNIEPLLHYSRKLVVYVWSVEVVQPALVRPEAAVAAAQ